MIRNESARSDTLKFEVLIIEQLENRIRVKVQDEYFFKSDNERWCDGE